jgi:hypothetical protein
MAAETDLRDVQSRLAQGTPPHLAHDAMGANPRAAGRAQKWSGGHAHRDPSPDPFQETSSTDAFSVSTSSLFLHGRLSLVFDDPFETKPHSHVIHGRIQNELDTPIILADKTVHPVNLEYQIQNSRGPKTMKDITTGNKGTRGKSKWNRTAAPSGVCS